MLGYSRHEYFRAGFSLMLWIRSTELFSWNIIKHLNRHLRVIHINVYRTKTSVTASDVLYPPPPKLIWLPGRQWFQSEIEKFSSTIFLLDSKSIFSTKYWSLKNTERRRERQRRDRDRERDRGDRETEERERGFIFIGSLNVERNILCRIYQM